jgi:hypothetical protein
MTSSSYVFRPALWVIAPASAILWFIWVLSGLVADRFFGYHDLFGVLLAAAAPIGLWFLAFQPIDDGAIQIGERKKVSPKAGAILGLCVWIGFAIWTYWAATTGKVDKLGQSGDSFGVINSLFLALGFFFTIRQLRHQEHSSVSAARLQAAPLLLDREKEIIKICESSRTDLMAILQDLLFIGKGAPYNLIDVAQPGRDLYTIAATRPARSAEAMRALVQEFQIAILDLNDDASNNPKPNRRWMEERAGVAMERISDLLPHVGNAEKESTARATEITDFIQRSFAAQGG